MSGSEASRENPITITWTTMKSGQVFVVALCRACKIVRERFIPGREDTAPLAQIVGIDALANAGCSHAAQAPSRLQSHDLPVPRTDTRARPPIFAEEEPTAQRPKLPSVSEEIVTPSSRDPRRDD